MPPSAAATGRLQAAVDPGRTVTPDALHYCSCSIPLYLPAGSAYSEAYVSWIPGAGCVTKYKVWQRCIWTLPCCLACLHTHPSMPRAQAGAPRDDKHAPCPLPLGP